jgi:hypothetical protein
MLIHLIPLASEESGGPLPHDLAFPKARELLKLLGVVASDVITRWNTSHCSTAEDTSAQLKMASDVLFSLVEDQCKSARSLPLVLFRCVFIALLLSISSLDDRGSDAQSCLQLAQKTSIPVFQSFARALSCSRVKKSAIEFYHASKASGGNSSQVPGLGLEPSWTRLEPGLDKKIVWAGVQCPAWQEEPELSCEQIEAKLKEKGYDFFSNEAALHLAPGLSNTSQPCAQFESILIIQDPVERTRSHVMEVVKSYKIFSNKAVSSLGSMQAIS